MTLPPRVLRIAWVVRRRGAKWCRGADFSLLQLSHDLLSATLQVVKGGLWASVGTLWIYSGF